MIYLKRVGTRGENEEAIKFVGEKRGYRMRGRKQTHEKSSLVEEKEGEKAIESSAQSQPVGRVLPHFSAFSRPFAEGSSLNTSGGKGHTAR